MPSDSSGHAAEFRRTLSEATGRVEAIIDAAEETAGEIRAAAERDADAYREQRKLEADAEVRARIEGLREQTGPLVARIEGLRSQASSLSDEIDATLARLEGLSDTSAAPARPAGSTPAVASASPLQAAPEPASTRSSSWTETVPGLKPSAEPASEPAPEPAPQSAEPAGAEPAGPAPVAYPGTGTEAGEAGDDSDQSEGALLRATQLAVSGSSRGEIEAALRSEFHLADVDSVLDGILGPEDR